MVEMTILVKYGEIGLFFRHSFFRSQTKLSGSKFLDLTGFDSAVQEIDVFSSFQTEYRLNRSTSLLFGILGLSPHKASLATTWG